MPQDPLLNMAPSAYLTACRIHSSMPARGPAAAPSEFPVYGLEFRILGFAGMIATTKSLVLRICPAH